MFDVAVYTDTRSDEAIDGIDGFNFQAISEGITAQDRQIIRDNMLHHVVVGWGVDNDPLKHPPSFVYYKHGDSYYLARGVSTGVTNNGRPGNLLTEAVTTSDSDDFGSMRPAQLFGAENWRLEKVEGKSVPQWAAPLKVSPDFESESLCAMIKDDPWAQEHLAEYLSMIEQVTAAEPKRLILLSNSEVLAQKWIALGTLFMDAQKAHELTIRGLVQDPMATKADIVAASPEFGQQPDPLTPRAGANVVDLDNRVIGPVTKTESAVKQAEWFLNEDSGSALAAIDLARNWEEYLGGDLAARAAAMASFPGHQGGHDDWLTIMQALCGLAKRGQTDELFFYGDALLDVAVTYAPIASSDANLAGKAVLALMSADSHDLAAGVLLPTLEAASGAPQAREALLATVGQAVDVPILAWDDDVARNQAAKYLSLMADEVSDDMLPDLFSVAMTLDIPLEEATRARAIARLARFWVSKPDLSTRRECWSYATEVTQALAENIIRGLEAGDQVSLTALERGAWSWLESSPVVNPSIRASITSWDAVARLARLPLEERAAALKQSAGLPTGGWRIVWSGANLPDDYEIVLALAKQQRTLASDAASWIYEQIRVALRAKRPATKFRNLFAGFQQSGIRIQHEELLAYIEQVARVSQHFRAAAKSREKPNPHLNTVVKYVPNMGLLMLDHLGEIILASPDTRGVSQIVSADEEIAEVAALYFLKKKRGSAADMAEAVKLALAAIDGDLNAPAQAAQDFLQDVCDNPLHVGRVNQAARGQLLDKRTFSAFEAVCKDAKKGRLKRRISRVTGGFWGGKGKEE